MIQVDLSFLGDELKHSVESKWADKSASALQALRGGTCKGSEWTGWFDWPQKHGQRLLEDIAVFRSALDVEYSAVVVIGIGGSYLGTHAAYQALTHSYGKDAANKPMFFLGQHLAPSSMAEVFDALEGHKPIVNIISKSGTTTEPAIAFRLMCHWLRERFGEQEMRQRLVFTTDAQKGTLRQLADQWQVPSFVVPDDVGGRFSVLTAVGLLPLAIAGLNVEAIMDGANQTFDEIKEGSDAVCLYAGARQALCQDDKKVVEFFAYDQPKLSMTIEWLKQLFGESEGKGGQGILPAGLAYTTDLHSLGQLVQDGKRNIFETFLYFEDVSRLAIPESEHDDGVGYLQGRKIREVNRMAMDATKLAHFDGGVPCICLRFGEIVPRTFGQLFAFFETACALSAAVQGVNPFDQPGVEAYKRNLFGLLGKSGFGDIGDRLRRRL